MKKRLISIISVAVLVVMVSLAAAWVTNGTAKAALVNTGVPAWCYTPILHAGESFTLTCFTPSGTVAFTNLVSVPNGYYFMVTDWVISPYSISSPAGNMIEIDLKEAYGSGGYYAINHFRFMDGATSGQHYFSPMWTLLAGEHLEVASSSASQLPFELRVSGFLTTNATYLPMSRTSP